MNLLSQEALQPHIKLKTADKVCFLSGNPDRVPIIADYLNDPKKVADYRGLVAYKGFTPQKQIPVTILTSGMGTGSSSIVLEEAYRAGGRIFLRIGSTGSLLPGKDMSIGTIFIPFAAVRDEGTSIQFAPAEIPAVASPKMFQTLCQSATVLNIRYQTGLVWTTDVYYQPDSHRHKKWTSYGTVCVEMESSCLFIFGLTKGPEVLTGTILTSDGNIEENNNIYTGYLEKNAKLFQDGVKKSIQCAIGTIELLNP